MFKRNRKSPKLTLSECYSDCYCQPQKITGKQQRSKILTGSFPSPKKDCIPHEEKIVNFIVECHLPEGISSNEYGQILVNEAIQVLKNYGITPRTPDVYNSAALFAAEDHNYSTSQYNEMAPTKESTRKFADKLLGNEIRIIFNIDREDIPKLEKAALAMHQASNKFKSQSL